MATKTRKKAVPEPAVPESAMMALAAMKASFAYARGQGYPDRIIQRAWIMHRLDGKSFFEKEWNDYLREADDGKN